MERLRIEVRVCECEREVGVCESPCINFDRNNMSRFLQCWKSPHPTVFFWQADHQKQLLAPVPVEPIILTNQLCCLFHSLSILFYSVMHSPTLTSFHLLFAFISFFFFLLWPHSHRTDCNWRHPVVCSNCGDHHFFCVNLPVKVCSVFYHLRVP